MTDQDGRKVDVRGEWPQPPEESATEPAVSYNDHLEMQRQRNALVDSLAECRGLLADAERRLEATWRCFHCGDTFTDDTSAREHFGSTEEATAACRLTAEDVKAIRQMDSEVEALLAENETLTWKAEAGEMQSVELERLFGKGANTAHGAWLRLDEKEGERLVEKERADVAERRLREAEADTTDWILVAEGIKHNPRCTDNAATGGSEYLCLRCRLREAEGRLNTIKAYCSNYKLPANPPSASQLGYKMGLEAVLRQMESWAALADPQAQGRGGDIKIPQGNIDPDYDQERQP